MPAHGGEGFRVGRIRERDLDGAFEIAHRNCVEGAPDLRRKQPGSMPIDRDQREVEVRDSPLLGQRSRQLGLEDELLGEQVPTEPDALLA